MKTMNKMTVAALALAAIGFASTAASAQTVTTMPGDLILGFQLSGNSTDLEVDLGPVSGFTTTATINLSSKLSVTDLNAFGNWSSTTPGTGVNWGVAGDTLTPKSLVLTSTGGQPLGESNSSLTPYYNDIGNGGGLTSAHDGINTAPQAHTTTSAVIGSTANPASGITDSYTNIEGELLGLNGSIETTGASTDELYKYVGTGFGSTTDLGTFSLTSTGGLTFTGSAAAVPEPSAYALGICAVLLFIVLRRRHSVA